MRKNKCPIRDKKNTELKAMLGTSLFYKLWMSYENDIPDNIRKDILTGKIKPENLAKNFGPSILPNKTEHISGANMPTIIKVKSPIRVAPPVKDPHYRLIKSRASISNKYIGNDALFLKQLAASNNANAKEYNSSDSVFVDEAGADMNLIKKALDANAVINTVESISDTFKKELLKIARPFSYVAGNNTVLVWVKDDSPLIETESQMPNKSNAQVSAEDNKNSDKVITTSTRTGYDVETEAHALGVLAYTFSLVTDYFSKNNKAVTTKTLKNTISKHLIKHANFGTKTDEQKALLMKMSEDIKTNKALWEALRRHMSVKMNIDMEDLESTMYGGLVAKKDWSDKTALSVNPNRTISDKLKWAYNNILLYESVGETGDMINFFNTPTGMPNFMDYRDVNMKLQSILGHSLDMEEMLQRIEKYSKRFRSPKGRSLSKFLSSVVENARENMQKDRSELSQEEIDKLDILNTMFTTYSNPDRSRWATLLKNNRGKIEVSIKEENRNAAFNVAQAAVETIKTNVAAKQYDAAFEDRFYALYTEFGKLINYGKELYGDNTNLEEVAKVINKMHAELGMNMPVDAVLSYMIEARSNPKAVPYDAFFVSNLNRIVSLKKANPNDSDAVKERYPYITAAMHTEAFPFNEHGQINKWAAVAAPFIFGVDGASTLNINGNSIFTVQKPSHMDDKMAILKSGDKAKIETFFKALLNDPSNWYSPTLVGNEYNVITDYDGKLKLGSVKRPGAGFINFYVDSNGQRQFISVKDGNIKHFDFVTDAGIKNISNNIAIDGDENYGKDAILKDFIMFFSHKDRMVAEKSIKSGGYVPVLIPMKTPSDAGTNAMFSIAKLDLSEEDFINERITSTSIEKMRNSKSTIYHGFVNALVSDVSKMQIAFDKIYDITPEGEHWFTPKQDVADGLVPIQMFYHYMENDSNDKPILVKNGKPTGRVFQTHKLSLGKNGKVIKLEDIIPFEELIGLDIDNFREYLLDKKTPILKSNVEKFEKVAKFVSDVMVQVYDNMYAALEDSKALIEKHNNPKTNRPLISDVSGSFHKAVGEFAYNYYLGSIMQKDLFLGGEADYKSDAEIIKRAKELIANGNRYQLKGTFKSSSFQDVVRLDRYFRDVYNHIVDGLVMEFEAKNGDTISDTRREELYEILTKGKKGDMLENPNDLEQAIYNIASGYTYNKHLTDGVTYITLEEFIKRTESLGRRSDYEPIIDSLLNGKPLSYENHMKLIQLQKNFYYSFEFDPTIGKHVPIQVKNSEIILTPSLIKNNNLTLLHNAMVEAGVVQVNAISAEKVGTLLYTSVTKDGVTPKEDLASELKRVSRDLHYESLRLQLDVADALVDHSGKFGIQIMRKILNNIALDGEYAVGEKTMKGRELVNKFHNLMVEWIKLDENTLLEEMGVVFDEDGTPNITNVNNSYSYNKEQFRDFFKEAALSGNMSSNSLFALDKDYDTQFNLPLFASMFVYKFEQIFAAQFTNRVIEKKFPGMHATQMTNLFLERNENARSTTYGNFDNSGEIQWASFKKGNETLAPVRKVGDKIYECEILIQPWQKEFFEDGRPIDINSIKDESLLQLLGYRIPTEDKHSMFVFKVVGFLPMDSPSAVVIPDNFTSITGSDFDIDSIYLMSYNTFVNPLDKSRTPRKYSPDSDGARYHSYINSTLRSDKFQREARALVDSDETVVSNLFSNKKELTKYAIEKGLLYSYENFKMLEENEQRSLYTNEMVIQNELMDMMIAILKSPYHVSEQHTSSGFADLSAASALQREYLPIVSGGSGATAVNNNDYCNEAVNRDRVREGRELKGISVAACATLDVFHQARAISDKSMFKYALKIKNDAHRAFLEKTYRSDVIIDGDRAVIYVKGLGVSNTGTSYGPHMANILSYASQSTANILDNVKDPIPVNVNKETLTWFIALASSTNDYTTPTLFLTIPIINDYLKTLKSTDGVYGFGDDDSLFALNQKALEELKENSDNEKIKKDLGVTTRRKAKDLEKLIESWGYESEYVFEQANVEKHLKLIEKQKSGETLTSEEKDFVLIQNLLSTLAYRKLRTVANTFRVYGDITSVNKRTANYETYQQVLKSDAQARTGNTLELHGMDANGNIYEEELSTSLLGKGLAPTYNETSPTGSDSLNPTITAFFTHGVVSGARAESSIFLHTNKFVQNLYNNLAENVFPKKGLNDRTYKSFISYLSVAMTSDLPFFDMTDTTKVKLLGYDNVVNLNLDITDVDSIYNFSELSVANQLRLIQNKYKNSLKYSNLLSILTANLSKEQYEYYGYHAIDSINSDNADGVMQDWSEMLYSPDPFERLLARNLIRYAFVNNGLTFGYSSLGKYVPPQFLANNSTATSDNLFDFINDTGCGLRKHLFNKQDILLDTLKADEDFWMEESLLDQTFTNIVGMRLNDFLFNFLRQSYETNIVPDITNIKHRIRVNGEVEEVNLFTSHPENPNVLHCSLKDFETAIKNVNRSDLRNVKMVKLRNKDNNDYDIYAVVIKDIGNVEGKNYGKVYLSPVEKLHKFEIGTSYDKRFRKPKTVEAAVDTISRLTGTNFMTMAKVTLDPVQTPTSLFNSIFKTGKRFIYPLTTNAETLPLGVGQTENLILVNRDTGEKGAVRITNLGRIKIGDLMQEFQAQDMYAVYEEIKNQFNSENDAELLKAIAAHIEGRPATINRFVYKLEAISNTEEGPIYSEAGSSFDVLAPNMLKDSRGFSVGDIILKSIHDIVKNKDAFDYAPGRFNSIEDMLSKLENTGGLSETYAEGLRDFKRDADLYIAKAILHCLKDNKRAKEALKNVAQRPIFFLNSKSYIIEDYLSEYQEAISKLSTGEYSANDSTFYNFYSNYRIAQNGDLETVGNAALIKPKISVVDAIVDGTLTDVVAHFYIDSNVIDNFKGVGLSKSSNDVNTARKIINGGGKVIMSIAKEVATPENIYAMFPKETVNIRRLMVGINKPSVDKRSKTLSDKIDENTFVISSNKTNYSVLSASAGRVFAPNSTSAFRSVSDYLNQRAVDYYYRSKRTGTTKSMEQLINKLKLVGLEELDQLFLLELLENDYAYNLKLFGDPSEANSTKGSIFYKIGELANLDLKDIMDSPEKIKQVADFINEAYIVLKSFNKVDKLINMKLKDPTETEIKLQELLQAYGQLSTRVHSATEVLKGIRNNFFEELLKPLSSNPNVIAGIKDVMGVTDDLSIFEQWFDSMSSSPNTFAALLHKLYIQETGQARRDGAKELEHFHKLVADAFGLKDVNDIGKITNKQFEDRYLERFESGPYIGELTGRFKQKYDYAKFFEDKAKFMKEVNTLYKDNKEERNKRIAQWYKENEIPVKMTVDEMNKIINAQRRILSPDDFRTWFDDNFLTVEYTSHSGSKSYKHYPKITGRTFVYPAEKYRINKELDNDELFQYMINSVKGLPMNIAKGKSLHHMLKETYVPVVRKKGEFSMPHSLTEVKQAATEYMATNFGARTVKSFAGEDGRITRFLPYSYFNMGAYADNKSVYINYTVDFKKTVKENMKAIYDMDPIVADFVTNSMSAANLKEVVMADGTATNATATNEDLRDFIKKHNTTALAERQKRHGEDIETNLLEVFDRFIPDTILHKKKAAFQSVFDMALDQFDDLKVRRKATNGDYINNNFAQKMLGKKTVEITSAENSRLKKRYEEWLEAVYYEGFDLDEGWKTSSARAFMKYVSAKNMWLNLTAGVNNVTYGRFMMRAEAAAGGHFNHKQLIEADKRYFKALGDLMVNMNNKYKKDYKTRDAAIINFMDIFESADERESPYKREKKNLFSSDTLYVFQHAGEHFMQSVAMLAMLKNYRIVEGKIYNEREYNILRDEKVFKDYLEKTYGTAVLGAYENFKIEIGNKKIRSDEKIDFIKEFLFSQEDYFSDRLILEEMRKTIPNILKEDRLKRKEEFEKHEAVDNIFKFEDGNVKLDKSKGVSDKEFESFRNRVIKVNQKMHGIYNKVDAGAIQRRWYGKVMMMFRKFIRPGIIKRFGTKFGRAAWDESSGEWNKGTYVSGVLMLRHLLMGYMKYGMSVQASWNLMDDTERANARSFAVEMSGLLISMFGLIFLQGLGDDDDDKPYALDFAIYQFDRLVSETSFYTPFGLFNEGKKIMSSPAASFSAMGDIGSALWELISYPFKDEEERTYQSGVYNNESKLKVKTKKVTPILNQWQKLDRISESNRAYALFRLVD